MRAVFLAILAGALSRLSLQPIRHDRRDVRRKTRSKPFQS